MQSILGQLELFFLRIEADSLYVIDALPSLQLRLSEEKASSHADFLLSLSGNEALPRIAAKVEAAIICLRDNPSIKAAMDQRHTFQLNDRFVPPRRSRSLSPTALSAVPNTFLPKSLAQLAMSTCRLMLTY